VNVCVPLPRWQSLLRVKRYTGLTTSCANFSGISFIDLRLPGKYPFEPLDARPAGKP
jgi:hypothetical protein